MKFTKKDFALFKKECERCVEILGLKQWRVDIFFEPTDDITLYATATCDYVNKIVALRLNSENSDGSECDVRETAKHEILEILLHRLGNMAEYGYPEIMVDAERHAVIRILEKIL